MEWPDLHRAVPWFDGRTRCGFCLAPLVEHGEAPGRLPMPSEWANYGRVCVHCEPWRREAKPARWWPSWGQIAWYAAIGLWLGEIISRLIPLVFSR